MKKKVTILALHLGYGGIEKYISSLCKMLEDNYEINIICTYKTTSKPAFKFNDNIKIKYLIKDKPHKEEMIDAFNNFKFIKGFKYLIRNIKMLINKNKLNIEAIKNIDSDYIITTRDFHNKLVSKYAKEGIIKIATEHNHHNNNKKYINRLIKSLDGFNYFVLVSKELKEFYQDKLKDTKAVYISNVIDNINDKIHNHNHKLISIGRLSEEKGFDDLIDVINILKDDIDDIHLDLIGDGKLYKSLNKKIEDLNLKKHITLHGFKNKDEINKIIKKCSLYVMTSHTESFGLVLVEAMSYGLPCIAFDSAQGARDLIIHNDLLIENRDKDKMADKIKNLLDDKKTLSKIGEENYEHCNMFLLENVKDKWNDLLKNKM